MHLTIKGFLVAAIAVIALATAPLLHAHVAGDSVQDSMMGSGMMDENAMKSHGGMMGMMNMMSQMGEMMEACHRTMAGMMESGSEHRGSAEPGAGGAAPEEPLP